MGYYYDDYVQNADAKVIITIPGQRGIEALLINDFMFAGSSEYTNMFEQMAESYNSKLDIAKAAIYAAAPSQQARLSKVSLRVVDQTILRWSGGGRPTFPISMMFVETKDGGTDVRDSVKTMYSTIFPVEGYGVNTKGINFRTYAPPLGYIGTASGKSAGTITLKIGRWFLATGLVTTSVNFTFSKEVTPKGTPLFATGDVNFESYRLMTNDEVQKFFL